MFAYTDWIEQTALSIWMGDGCYRPLTDLITPR
jgi:hypothetical protein